MDALTEADLKISLSFYDFKEQVKEFKNYYSQIEPVFCKGFIGSNSEYRCPAGSEKITLMPDGSVYPCYLLARLKEFKIGNIFEASLSKILSSQKLKIFKTLDDNVCHNKICNHYEGCKGGALLIA